MYVILLIVLAFIAKMAKVHIKTYISRLSLSAIPQAPLDSWFIGHKNTVDKAKAANKFLDLFVDWTREYGPTVVFWMKIEPFIFTSDPGILKEVTTDLQNFIKVQKLPNRSLFGQKLVGYDSILSGNGVMWGTKRKLMTPYFAKTNLKQVFQACKPHMQVNQLARWRGLIGGEKTVCLHDQLSITFTSYLQVLGLGSSNPELIADQVYKILDIIPRQNSHKLYTIFTKEKKDMVAMVKHMRSELRELVSEGEYNEVMQEAHPEPTNLLGYLIRANSAASDADPAAVVESTVNDLMTVYLVLDNLTKQIASLFMHLKQVPEVQERMLRELRDNPIQEFEDLEKLRYTEQCILEGMRVSPALLRGTRHYMARNNSFGCYSLPSITRIQIHFSEYVMHHSEQYWSNPKQFDPERWNPGFSIEQFSYIPFLAGARSCLGKHVAMMLMKLTLSVLVSNFDITQDYDKENPPVISQNYAVMRIKNQVGCHFIPIA